MKNIVFVGIPGVGKSSILQQVPSVQVVNYGDKMLEVAALEGITRDTLRKMPIREQQEIGVKAAHKMAEQADTICIIDTHAMVKTKSGYIPGLPRQVLEILSPVAYVLVESEPSHILQRRDKDNSRFRDRESEEEITLHQQLTRTYITSCAMYTGSLLCYVRNDSPSLSQNALPLLNLIQNI